MFLNAVSGSSKSLFGAMTLGAIVGFTTINPASAVTAVAQTAANAQQVAQVNNFTSSDWLKGTWRASPGVSIPATASNKAAFKKNGKVKLANGQVRTIKAIYFSGAHMSLMLDGAKLDANATGHPKSVTALSGSTTTPSTPAPTPGAGNSAHSSAINNFTNSDWLNGVWRKSAGVSVPATAANRSAFKAGASVKLADGQVREIGAVYVSGSNMSVMLKGAKLNAATVGYPKTVAAVTTSGTAPAPVTPPAPAPQPPAQAAHGSVINNFTNSDWLNGVWRKSAGVSVPATAANRSAFKAGASVKLADGQVRTISAIYVSGNNMSVMLKGAAIGGNLGYPNKLFAATANSVPSTPAPDTTPPAGTKPALTVTLNAFNGKDFAGGVYLTSPGISIKDTSANRAAFHKGAKVRFADGQVRTVKTIYRSGGNMTVLLDGGAIDGKAVGFPRTISVSSSGFSQPAPDSGNSSAPSNNDTAPGNPINLVGVNLAGAEFGAGNSASASLPGRYQIHYIYPGEADFKRYADLGMKLVRLPFRWERLQPKLNTELNAAELSRLIATLDHARKHDVQVILDMHNYYRYYGKLIASGDVPISAFADSWRRIARKVANHPAVYGYGLMNEPHSTNGKWPAAALAASKAIREIDRKGWIYVAGDRWSSAYHWPSYNTQLVADPWMRDPKNNLIYEAHLYLDKDFSGSYANRGAVYGPMTGVDRAKPFVEWLRKHRLRGFIGEHGAPDYSPSAIVATDNLLKYLGQNCIPSTYWAAGPWWGDYPLSLDVNNGKARPQLPVLRKHATNKSCTVIGPL